jgi:hypothetical protein
MDIVYLILTIVFFMASILMVYGCEKLREQS